MTKLSEDIISLHNQGMSYNQIKEQLGCSKGSISYHLGMGQKEKTVARTRDRRNKTRKYIQEVKSKSLCADCGENYPWWMMQFDHLGDKLFEICDASKDKKLPLVIEEIAKCEIVCANCHANRTYVRAFQGGNGSLDVASLYE